MKMGCPVLSTDGMTLTLVTRGAEDNVWMAEGLVSVVESPNDPFRSKCVLSVYVESCAIQSTFLFR